MYKNVIKRLIDFILSSIAIIVLALPMLIISIVIKIDDPGPVLFKQKRVGKKKNGEITYFMIWKFRSMKVSTPRDTPTHLLDNPEQYITRVGRFIRKTSLDELPQFFNVLKGDMSLVGTRPPTVDEYEKYTPEQKRRLSFKPGITGLWQVSGRSEITDFDEVVRLDVSYIDDWTIWSDIKILLKTIKVVFKRDGAK